MQTQVGNGLKPKILVYKLLSLGRLCQGPFSRPMTSKVPFVELLPRYFKRQRFSPLIKCHSYTIIRYFRSTSSIENLLKSGRPLTVIRRIVLIIINSIQGISFFWYSHIFNKFRKVIPTFTHFYTTFTIPIIVRVIWIVTSLSCIYPRLIDWMSGVLRFIFNGHVVLSETVPTTAVISSTVNKVRFNSFDRATTIATKQPDLSALVVPNNLYSRKHLSFNSCKISDFLVIFFSVHIRSIS